MGGSGPLPPTYVQTPPEISANSLKSFFIHGVGGIPCMYIVTFTARQQRKNGSDPHFFWAGDATVYNIIMTGSDDRYFI